MAEFDSDDLRPFSAVSRPRTSGFSDERGEPVNAIDDPLGGDAPEDGRPTTSGIRPFTGAGMRPFTGAASRPTTAGGVGGGGRGHHDFRIGSAARPKTGYRASPQIDMSRPMSRVGSAVGDRPASSFGGRPMTSSSSARVASAMGNRGVPGTASRLLASAMQNRPVSRTGIGLQTPINVADRPVTQQGLSGIRTGTAKGPQRQYQDKSYFMGLLRTKMNELQTEVNKISREIEDAKEEQSTFLEYDKRVKELAAELTEAQGVLADYNLLVDKLNTDTDKAEVEDEVSELKVQNDTDSAEVDALFAEKQDRDKMIEQMEREIEEERNMADNLIAAMQPELREKFAQLKGLNLQYQSDMERMNQELDMLNSQKKGLEDELSMSAMKREALALYEQLREAEEKRDKLIMEEKERGTPAQEREKLLQQVKDDNAEISTMERQIAEFNEKLSALQEEQTQLEQEIEENQSERNQKYRELRKREENMDHFLANFEDNKAQELQRLSDLEREIQTLTEKMSQHLAHVGHLPTTQSFTTMKDDLSFKEGEMEKSKYTLEGVSREQAQLKMNLEKIEALEGKIQSEMTSLRESIHKMEDELVIYSDLDRLKAEAEEKRQLLESQRTELVARKEAAEEMLKEMQEKANATKKALLENETHVQLSNLEKKWSHLEQNNFTIQEFIATKKAELNFEPVRNKVVKMQTEYNRILVDALKSKTNL